MEQTRDKKLWIFNAGNSFSGNPKWLFEYIVRHRKDITPVWMCYDNRTCAYVKKLQYTAALYQSGKGRNYMKKAGVYVVEMCKEVIQPELEGVTILNLWHGVGCKSIERKVTGGFLQERIAKKYIQNNRFFKNNQLFLVTSELMENHFKEQCGVDDALVIRAGYPRCTVKDAVCTYEHDIRRQKGLSKDAQIVVYAPTYRDYAKDNFIKAAIWDWDALLEVLQEKNMLLVFKMHPLIEKDATYLQAKEQYQNHPNLLFWDNANDIYEIFQDVDAAIIDYSSIFYDFMARGVRKLVRYFMGSKDELRDFVFDVEEMTCGTIANTFPELLEALRHLEPEKPEEIQRIWDLFWSYSGEDSCEKIIQRALEFTPLQRKLPTLYSFDVFDTLITRKFTYPTTVFGYVQEKMRQSGMGYSSYLMRNYSLIRQQCEKNVREYYRKSELLRKDDHYEIQFVEIFDRMEELYHLTPEQKKTLMAWEVEAELEAIIPIPEQIERLKQYLAEGNTVVLISDMYLPEDVIKEMLRKADPVLETVPLYLSSTIGHQKTTKKLFLHVYAQLDYVYEKWIHIGDNQFADHTQPSQLGIETQPIEIQPLTGYERRLAEYSNHYAYRMVSKMLYDWRVKQGELLQDRDNFAYCYASLYLVPYVIHGIMDACNRGYKTIYFVSRDGHYLKQIADEVIRYKKLPIRTKYIYGSRKAWRIPSFIKEIDEEFFSEYGSLMGLQTFEALLSALRLTEEQFDRFFPELAYVKKESRYSLRYMQEICGVLKESIPYREYLLQVAKEERGIVIEYLRQEINFAEPFAFMEYWGRGYTQDCLTRLLEEAAGEPVDNPMYYVRSIYPTYGHSVRHNYSANMHSLVFVESIFANVPYQTISQYERKEGKIVPVLVPNDNDKELHRALETYLPAFCRDYLSLELPEEDTVGRLLYDFALMYFSPKTKDEVLLNVFPTLKDSVALGDSNEEYAPPITLKTVVDWMHGKSFRTKNLGISMSRSALPFRMLYKGYAFYCKKIRDAIRRKQGKKIY